MVYLIKQLIFLYEVIIIIRVIMSWVPSSPTNRFTILIQEITEPVLRPVRNILPQGSTLDFSPLIVLISLHFIKTIL